jgi:hypothetical protein
MTTKRLSRLLALSNAESGRRPAAPVRQRFKALNVNLIRLSGDWERQRGAVARMMGVVLREDSESLFTKVSADAATAATFADAIGWLEDEAVYLRKLAARMDTAASRLGSAITRYRSTSSTCVPAASVPGQGAAVSASAQ